MSGRQRLALAALALLAAASAAHADVTLTGNQHIGDCDDAGGGCTGFTPLDPVSRNQMFNYPVNFTLTTTTTIDTVTVEDAVDLDGKLQIYLETRGTSLGSSSSHFGTLSGSTFDLVPDLVLAPGEYVILPDGGCSESSGGTFFYNCPGGKVNDIGFSAITLASAQSGTTVMLNQRRHLGDSNDPSGDDDYDFSGTVSSSSNEFYPDAPDGTDIDLSFTLAANLRLTQIKFYRLRDVNTESPTNATSPKVLVNGSQVGELTGEGDPFTLTLATALLMKSGTHTLRVESGSFSGQRDDFSWDDIVLRFADTGASGTPGFFNAVDVGGDVLTGSIQTKVAGGAFTLDLYALTGFGTGQDTTYNGTASVEVLDATSNSGSIDIYGCRSSWSTAQSLGDVIFVGGTAQVTGAFLDAGLKEARIKVTDSTTSASGCSLDNFAIRPASFSVAPSHDTDTTAGTATALTNAGTSGLPRHRAGQPFTIVATAMSANNVVASNYAADPEVTATAVSPATTTGALNTPTWYAAGGGVRRTDNARYREVGPVSFAVTDSSWADVDAGDTDASNRSFTGTAIAGRFVPDHFKVEEGTLAPACALGGFSYLGSSLAWATPAVKLTAECADDPATTPSEIATTMNYEGTLEKLPTELAQPTYALPTYAALTGTLDATGLSTAPTISNAAAGSATITLPPLKFERTLIGAFDAEIRITFPPFTDEDDTPPAESPIVLGALSAGGGVAFAGLGNPKSQRFGRLYFEPRYGSDLRSIDVPLRAEYFDGVTFVPNTADVCTTLQQVNLSLSAISGTVQAATLNPAGAVGPWSVEVSAPVPTDQGTAVLSITGTPYPLLLVDDTDADAVYDDDPSGTVTFGLHEQGDRRIYQREVVGN